MALPTISYIDIAKIPFPVRQSIKNSPLADMFTSMLTPGQQAALFPSYVNEVFTSALPSQQRIQENYGIGGIAPSSTRAPVVRGGTNSEVEKLKKSLIPASVIPGPDGKPMRVPDQVNISVAKDIGNGLNLSQQQRMAIVQKAIEDQLRKEGYAAKDLKAVAAAFTGQVARESGFDPTAEHDTDQNGKPTGYGIYGARLERRDAMFAWLSENGYEKDSLVGQARFMAYEAYTKFPSLMDKLSNMDRSQLTDGKDNMTFLVASIFENPKNVNQGLNDRYTGATTAYGIDLTGVETDGMTSEQLQTAYNLSPTEIASLSSPTATPLSNLQITADSIASNVVDDYLYEKYLAGTGKYGNSGIRAKDEQAAAEAGMSLKEYVIGGMNKKFKMNIFSAGQEMDRQGLEWGINSGFRGDERQAMITSGIHAQTGYSWHGGSQTTGGYGNGLAIDITGVGNTSRESVFHFLDTQGGNYGIGRPYGDSDKPHVTALIPEGEAFRGGGAGRIFSQPYGYSLVEQLAFAGGYDKITEAQTTALQQAIEAAKEEKPKNDTASNNPIPPSPIAVKPQPTATSAAIETMNTTDGLALPANVTPSKVNTASTMMASLPTGYNAAAGGAEITDPSYIVSEDGKKLTKVAETGPEKVEMKITPRNRAEQFGPTNQPQILQIPQTAGKGDDQKMNNPYQSNFGQEISQQAGMPVIDVGHQQLGLSPRIAYSQSKFISPFNIADVSGDTGMTYITRGIG